MRIIPTVLYLLGQYGNTALDDRVAEVIHNMSKCTHAHVRCQMACGIFCSVVFQMACGGDLVNAVKSGIDSALAYYRQKPEFSEVIHEFEFLGQINQRTEEEIRSSGYVIHTLQASL